MTEPYKTLVDNSIWSHTVTHETRTEIWKGRWGNIDLELPVVKDFPKPPRQPSENWLQAQIECLPRVAALAVAGKIKLFTSVELVIEKMRGTPELTLELEYQLFRGIPVEYVPPAFERPLVWNASDEPFGPTKEELEEFLSSVTCSRFRNFVALTQGNKQPDVLHLMTAENAGLDCYVTVDGRFNRSVNSQTKVALSVDVLSPCELCDRST